MTSQISSRLEAIVSGHVQGVYFRHYTVQEARKLGAVGWVANQMDGKVRLVAEGSREDLDQLLSFLHTGPPAAVVDRVEANWLEPTGEYRDFHVLTL